MSSLVADFVINPVLRQARRFSGNTNQRGDLAANRRTGVNDASYNEELTTETAEPLRSPSAVDEEGSISGRTAISLYIQEDGGLEAHLAAFNPSGTGRESVESRSAIPSRAVSSGFERMSDGDNVSSNPSFGILNRFQTASPISTSFRSSPRAASRRSTGDSAQSTSTTGAARQQNSSLPEDDGMSHLRRKIIKIQELNISTGEKARLMHSLLTESYSQLQISLHAKDLPRAYSPASVVSQERPTTPGSLSSFGFWQTSTNDTPPQSSPSSTDHAFHLSQDDLKVTYAPVEARPAANSDYGDSDDTECVQPLGCRHYKRNVKLQCFTCGRWYTCRFCHDEVEDHVLNRKETRNMLCMLCGSAQRASDICISCGVRAAWYYCGICKLWDDDANKSIYHCADCGICRIGRGIGKDYIHCKTCGVCVYIANEKSHKCIERASDCDCPICGEYLFSSLQSVIFMRCGHSIHRKCHDALMKTSYKCPICSQSVVNMETRFRNLDRDIESQPMPPQFQDTKAVISCNDCYAKSLVKYHWLGLKCAICDSYNTVQVRILSDPDGESLMEVWEAAGSRHMHIQEDISSTDAREQFTSSAGSAVSRRHSSHIRPIPSETDSDSLRFSPYNNIPQRMGRSVSPFRTAVLSDNLVTVISSTAESDEGEGEGEGEDEIEFWGGDAPRSPVSGNVATEEDEESDDDSVLSMEEGDDGDDEDHMELLGHR